MKSRKHWQDRAIDRTVRAEMLGVELMGKVLPVYDEALRQINKDINKLYTNYADKVGLDVVELTKVLTGADRNNFIKEVKKSMKVVGLNVNDIYDENYIVRLNRLEALKQQIYWKVQEITPKIQTIETGGFKKVVDDSYIVASEDIREQMGDVYSRGGTFNRLNDDMIDDVLASKWVGGNYMTRTGVNMDRFAVKVRDVVGSGLSAGISQEKMTRNIRERFDVVKYDTMRIVRTETNYFQNQSELLSYENEGVEYYEYVAVMDGRTSDICEKLDNKVFKISEAVAGENYPPMHPNCRSTTVVSDEDSYIAGGGVVEEEVKGDPYGDLYKTQIEGLRGEGWK